MGAIEKRPWGHYEIYEIERGALTKRIEIFSGMRFSLQKHLRRSEKWVIVSGYGLATVGERQWKVRPGDFVDIPVGEIHRMYNTGHDSLVFLELQLGNYLAEDDIIRLEDDYGRLPQAAGRSPKEFPLIAT